MKKKLLYILSACCILTACQDTESIFNSSEQEGSLINVGGISVSDELNVYATEPITRADGGSSSSDDPNKDAAEKQEWLITPLKQGLDITYGRVGSETTTNRVAILKLADPTSDSKQQELAGPTNNQYAVDKDSKWAIYSFKYRGGDDANKDAWWHGNGAHYFEGQYVPEPLRYGSGTSNSTSTAETVNSTSVPGLHSNQTDNITSEGVTTGNYTLLEQYLGMPANTRLSATVARVVLPFRHRLCRVIAYVLIDPSLGEGVTLEGYKKANEEQTSGKDNPETTEIHFSNVDVLAGVEDNKDADGHHTLTPQWMTARKVVPHFVGERESRGKDGKVLAESFMAFMDLDKETYTYPTDDDWQTKKTTYETSLSKNGNDVEKTEKACKIRRIDYGKVPVYDIIARPTYTKIDSVMYDEAGVKLADGTENVEKKKEYLSKTNKIDFDLTLSNGLQYSKEFKFDLNANYQTVLYLRISPESVDYNSSGSELWVNEQNDDDWYGIDNQNGNSLSIAGSSWQRAYTLGSIVSGDKVTDGGFYNEETTGEDGTANQYLKDATWKKYFAQAYEGGEHHGDYFILNKDITIDASELPANFVFTGHLDAQGHTITFTGGGSDVYEVTTDYSKYPSETPSEVLYIKNGSSFSEYTMPTALYTCEEIAQAKPRKTAGDSHSIEKGNGMMKKIADFTLQNVMNNGETYYIEDEGKYILWNRPTLYTHRTGASALFCGLNGIYTTKQEEATDPFALPANQWEANVHKEKNNKGTAKEYWVPYKGTNSGWRAEVINTKVKGAMFTSDAKITGNVQNCFDGDAAATKVENRTPEYPKYK